MLNKYMENENNSEEKNLKTTVEIASYLQNIIAKNYSQEMK